MSGKINIKYLGGLLIVLSAIFYGSASISVKLSVGYLTLWQTAMGRFLLGLILIPFLAWGFKFDLMGKHRGLLLFRGIANTISFLCLIMALSKIPLSIAHVLFYLWPAFSCMMSPWVAGEPIKKVEWLFVIIALMGMVLILWQHSSTEGLSVGHLFALCASFFTGLAVILLRPLGRDNNAFTLYFYLCVAGVIICAGPILSKGSPCLPVSVNGWLLLMAVASFAMTGQVLLNQGMKFLNAPKAGVLMMIEVLITVSFGVIFLGESLALKTICGACLILGSGVALVLVPTRGT
ncbi:DMT family transporter [Thermodesulfobacteriota bacterium]